MKSIRQLPVPLPYNETDLLQRLSLGDKDVFSHVFKEYYGALCLFAERITGSPDDVEDLVEDVFEKLWSRRIPFENLRHLKDFLYKVTRNACLDFLKHSTRRKERQYQFLLGDQPSETTIDLEIIGTEIYREIYREIKQLPEQCGRIVRMGYIEGKNNEEIALELGISIQTVKNQKSKGVALLRTRLSPGLFAFLVLLNTSS